MFNLKKNKLASVARMNELGWGENCEAWKWRMRLFAWEEELVRECIERLTLVVLQEDIEDRWVLNLYSSSCYKVNNTYKNLSDVNDHINPNNSHILCLEFVPLKVSIFV